MARRSKEQMAADRKLLSEIITALETNPKAVARAIILIGNAQTADEQLSHAALQHNGVGWTMVDADYGTWLYSVAKQNGTFYGKILTDATRIAKKYAKTQLFEAAKAKRKIKEASNG